MGFDRLPADILFHIFTLFSSAKDLCKCSMVCKRWNNVLEEDRTWLQLLERTAPLKYRSSDLLSTLSGSKAKLIAFENAWNSNDCSQNINLQENKLTLHRKPVAQCTDAIRGKCGYLYGEHYWTVTWHGPKFGSNAVVGVATEKEVVHKKGYCGLLGSSCESWGWDISKGVLRHEDDEFTTYPKEDIEVKIGQTIGVTLDATKRTLSFDLNGCPLGLAFTKLPPCRLYPAVSAVFGHSEISLVYHGLPLVG